MADKTKAIVQTSFRADKFYPRGTELDADDPAVKRWPSMFDPPAVRTTAAVPGEVVDPDRVTGRPSQAGTKAQWRAYVRALGGDTGELTKAELQALADELEGG